MPPDRLLLPVAQSCPPVRPVYFEPSPRGFRYHDEVAELAYMTPGGFEAHRCRVGYGPRPKWLTPEGGGIRRYIYTDEAVAKWLHTMKPAELSWLHQCQHLFPLSSTKEDAFVSASRMRATAEFMQKRPDQLQLVRPSDIKSQHCFN